MTSLSRRNACPTIARPMATGDGLLARLSPVGPLSPDAIRAVCDAAQSFGNGIVEITARGSIQVRGLSAATAAPFTAALAEAGVHDASPAIVAPPLAGHDPGELADVGALVQQLRAAIAAARIGPRLAPKTSVVVDGGGSLHLDGIDADLRLVATDESRFYLGLGGSAAAAKPVGSIGREQAADAVLAVLALLAEAGPAARGRDLDPVTVAAAVDAAPASPPTPRRAAEPVGIHRLAGDACAVGIGFPFGQTEATTLSALLDAAADSGATAFAAAEARTLIVLGIARDSIAGFRDRAAALGFIVRPDDPRRGVVACAGAPACAAGLMPARAIAAEVTRAAEPMLDGSVTLHVSGCTKGCAHPRSASLTFVGGEYGAGLVVSGRAGDTVAGYTPPHALPAAVARLAAEVSAARHSGETSAAAIARLGADLLAATLTREPADA